MTAPRGESRSSSITSAGSRRSDRRFRSDSARDRAHRHRRRFRHQPRGQPRDRRGASPRDPHEHEPDGVPAGGGRGGRPRSRLPRPERGLAFGARPRRHGGRPRRARASARPFHGARRCAADARGLAPRRAPRSARPALRAGLGRAHWGPGAGVLPRAPSLEVLRPVGRRDASGADQRRRPAPPVGYRAGPGRDRADLSCRLRGRGTRLELRQGARSRAAHPVRSPRAAGAGRAEHSAGRVPQPAGGRSMIAVISVYMQYAQGLRRLGCDVYWLEQFRPPASGDPEDEASLLSPFFERMKRFGLEGKTLLYSAPRGATAGPASFRFVGCAWPDVESVLKRADLLLNFHYAIDPRLLGCARRTALVDIDPGLLQFWISTGQLRVPAHDCYLTTGETVGTPS